MGMPILGDYTAYAGSHELNHLLTLEILSDAKNYEIVNLKDKAFAKEYSKVFA